MDKALRDLITISRAVGGDPTLVQGGGGNTSVKSADGEFMYIKASGAAIKDISETRGWRRLRVSAVKSILAGAELAQLDTAAREAEVARLLLDCCEDTCSTDARPSVESHLHASLGRCVVHLHPTVVCAYVCARNGQAELEKLFRRLDLPPLWVPYADPGYMLARSVARLTEAYTARQGRGPSILFLQKHGLLVTAETPVAVLRLVKEVISVCQQGLKWHPAARMPVPSADEVVAAQAAVRKALWEATGTRFVVRHFVDAEIAAFLALTDARALASLPSLMPDELACAQGPPLWVDRWEAEPIGRALSRRTRQDDRPPVATLRSSEAPSLRSTSSFLGKDMGLLVAGTEKSIPAIRDLIVTSLTVRGHAARFGGPNPLNRRQRDFIAKWEGENFRRAILAGLGSGFVNPANAGFTKSAPNCGSGAGELAGHIALVTGAGSGLGRAISIGLAQAGALVALADVDGPAADETADEVRRGAPLCAPPLPLRCDVTDEATVDRAYHAVLEWWGGLDILVNAAGVAPAYDLVDLPAREWRRAVDINLTGYFLMARGAARIMIRQGMGGAIINLSSKSGLDASRSNTPYNATKAGEIHMARGWALELGQHGIRVNSVAPGNVFQGSKIWNRTYIEACARKYGIRPEEVIPYYVSLTALKREITGQDVADAVIFLCSDRARTITGQTLVVDGGQAMVR